MKAHSRLYHMLPMKALDQAKAAAAANSQTLDEVDAETPPFGNTSSCSNNSCRNTFAHIAFATTPPQLSLSMMIGPPCETCSRTAPLRVCNNLLEKHKAWPKIQALRLLTSSSSISAAAGAAAAAAGSSSAWGGAWLTPGEMVSPCCSWGA